MLKVEENITRYLLAFMQSIGEILDDNKRINLVGLILEGALMSGEAMHDIGSDCLVRYVLLNDEAFKKESYKEILDVS